MTIGTIQRYKPSRYQTESEIIWEVQRLCEYWEDPRDKYDMISELGSGGSGTVFLAVSRHTNERVGIKKMDIFSQNIEMLLMEIKTMKEQNHKNLVQFIECYLTKDHCG